MVVASIRETVQGFLSYFTLSSMVYWLCRAEGLFVAGVNGVKYVYVSVNKSSELMS